MAVIKAACHKVSGPNDSWRNTEWRECFLDYGHSGECKFSSPGQFDPFRVSVSLMGCCSYEASWHPGIQEWGSLDDESRRSGYVSVNDYEALLSLYEAAIGRVVMP